MAVRIEEAPASSQAVIELLKRQFSANRVLFNTQSRQSSPHLNIPFAIQQNRLLLLQSQPSSQMELLIRSMINSQNMRRRNPNADEDEQWEDDYEGEYNYDHYYEADEDPVMGDRQVEVDIDKQAVDADEDDKDQYEPDHTGLEQYYGMAQGQSNNDEDNRGGHDNGEDHSGDNYSPADNNDDDWEDQN